MDGRETGVVDVIRMRGNGRRVGTDRDRDPVPDSDPFPSVSPDSLPLPLWSIPIPSAVSRAGPDPFRGRRQKAKPAFRTPAPTPSEASVDVARGRAPFESRAGSSDRFGDFGNLGVWSVLPATERKRKIGRARARTPRPARQGGEGGRKKNHSTQDSHVVPHHGTNWAALRLTSQIGRDAVLSESYGRGYWCSRPRPKSPPAPKERTVPTTPRCPQGQRPLTRGPALKRRANKEKKGVQP